MYDTCGCATFFNVLSGQDEKIVAKNRGSGRLLQHCQLIRGCKKLTLNEGFFCSRFQPYVMEFEIENKNPIHRHSNKAVFIRKSRSKNKTEAAACLVFQSTS